MSRIVAILVLAFFASVIIWQSVSAAQQGRYIAAVMGVTTLVSLVFGMRAALAAEPLTPERRAVLVRRVALIATFLLFLGSLVLAVAALFLGAPHR